MERVIKQKGGTFKYVNRPQIIGDSAKDKDLDDIMKMPGERGESDGEGSSDVEDNDEGMGDIDIEGIDDNNGEAALDDDEEETKEEESKKLKKKKKAAASDDEDDEDV